MRWLAVANSLNRMLAVAIEHCRVGKFLWTEIVLASPANAVNNGVSVAAIANSYVVLASTISFMLQIWMKLMVLMLLMMSNLAIMTMMMILMIRPGEGGTFCWLTSLERAKRNRRP